MGNLSGVVSTCQISVKPLQYLNDPSLMVYQMYLKHTQKMKTDKKGERRRKWMLSESIFFPNLYSFAVKTWSKTLADIANSEEITLWKICLLLVVS